ncbi:peptidase inhibitor family I36 protein [uncultured Thiothrix sp.]|uniref:peptidase inhibitor family I36 protein n=1 Tax=uncultured Thiothrix sp. TaxID=223185 RepID=UPI0026234E5A|nr:peptidase inhibitor family I36 protein [uncultured Thiothrix sp.]
MSKHPLFCLLVANALTLSVAQANCEVFEHINYEGGRFSVLPGQNIPSVGPAWNDRISSVKTSNSCRLIAFEHDNYEGDQRVFTGNTSSVGNLWNDQISSLQCQCPTPPQPACLMYEHINFTGAVLPVRGNLNSVGPTWNDRVSSVRVPNNCQLTVYQHIDYDGDSRTFGPGAVASVGNLWNDQISSAVCSCR